MYARSAPGAPLTLCNVPHSTPHSPFYVWLGCSRSRDTTKAIQAYEIEAGNRVIVSARSDLRPHAGYALAPALTPAPSLSPQCPPSFPELSFAHLLAQKQEVEASARSSALTRRQDEKLEESSVIVRRRGSESSESDAASDSVRLDLGPKLPLSSFHYQRRQWRLPFVDNKFSEMFRTWIVSRVPS